MTDPVASVAALAYDAGRDVLTLTVDFSSFTTNPVGAIEFRPAALGNRIAVHGLANGSAALGEIILEHAARVQPDAAGVSVVWQTAADAEKSTQLDALADAIEAARAFFAA